jgi:putative DNA-invertase from lambdoid prophage Rac
MAHIAYFRVSTTDQSMESQRQALLRSVGANGFDKEFGDEGVSGSVLAADRPQFAALLHYIREGDTLHVYAVDRLGRDALDVQSTVRALLNKGVTVDIHGLGPIGRGVGELILAVLAQVADMERRKIIERTAAGREVARALLAQGKPTQHGKASLGRPAGRVAGGQVVPQEVAEWRKVNSASIAATAQHWNLSTASVKRYLKLHS